MSNRELIFPLKSPHTARDLIVTNAPGIFVDREGAVWREEILQDSCGMEYRRLQAVHLLPRRLWKLEDCPRNPATRRELIPTTDVSLFYDKDTLELFVFTGLMNQSGGLFAILSVVLALEEGE